MSEVFVSGEALIVSGCVRLRRQWPVLLCSFLCSFGNFTLWAIFVNVAGDTFELVCHDLRLMTHDFGTARSDSNPHYFVYRVCSGLHGTAVGDRCGEPEVFFAGVDRADSWGVGGGVYLSVLL